jgi:hypothetical protein
MLLPSAWQAGHTIHYFSHIYLFLEPRPKFQRANPFTLSTIHQETQPMGFFKKLSDFFSTSGKPSDSSFWVIVQGVDVLVDSDNLLALC